MIHSPLVIQSMKASGLAASRDGLQAEIDKTLARIFQLTVDSTLGCPGESKCSDIS
jgi:hypothetical protein